MNVRTVRKKIKSVKNVRKITRAMQLVSAVKMRKAQQSELESRPYREELNRIISKIIGKVSPDNSELLKKDFPQAPKDLIILVSSNKGLAGAFNVSLFRFLLKINVDFSKTDFVTVGNKGAQFTGRMGSKVIADFSTSTSPIVEVTAVFSLILEKFYKGEYKSVSVVYNKFISTLKSEQVRETLLPLKSLQMSVQAKQETGEYIVEPSPEEIIDHLLKSYLEDKIRGAIISSEAVEHSMRMMAMKNATDNAGDVIYNLTLVGNKLRQEKITNELLDMVTAKESVEGN